MNNLKDVSGLLLAADLAVSEAHKKLAGCLHGSQEEQARIQLATALQALEMAKYHLLQAERTNQKS